MNEISDELLMAYADQELDAVEHARIHDVIMRDPELRTRLQAFESTRDVLMSMFDRPMREPVPEHLIKLVIGSPARTALAVSPKDRAWQGFSNWIGTLLTLPNAVAAAAVLVVGTSAGWMARDSTNLNVPTDQLVTLSDGKIIAQGALRRVLETSPSGQINSAGGGKDFASLKVLGTFKTSSNGFCREYELIVPTGARHTGIGCRDTSGRWSVEAYAPAAVKPKTSGVVVPSGAPKIDIVDTAIERMSVGDVFQTDQEARVIARGWLGE